MTMPIATTTTTSAPDVERPARAPGRGPWDGEEFSFEDVLDLVNPLQHIPIVGSIYRSATGDRIGMVPPIIGGALLGGPIGLILGVINAVIESATGKDAGEHVIAMLNGEESLPATTEYAAVPDAERDHAWTPPSYPAGNVQPPTQLAYVVDHERGVADYFQSLASEPPALLAVAAPQPVDVPETATTTGDALPAPHLDGIEEIPPAATQSAGSPPGKPVDAPPAAAARPLPFMPGLPGIPLGRLPAKAMPLNRVAAPGGIPLETARALPIAPPGAGPAAKPLVQTRPPPMGEAQGVWFPQQMIGALDKYQSAARLALPPTPLAQ